MFDKPRTPAPLALPSEVKIGTMVYQVEEISGFVRGDSKTLGQIEPSAEVIRIERNQGPQSKRITFWHEILHGILFNAGRDEHNEELVDLLAHGVVGVLQDNPEL